MTTHTVPNPTNPDDVSLDEPRLAAAEARLAQAIAPEPPPPALRRRVRRAVAQTWREEHPGFWARARGALSRPPARLAWGAVAALFALALLALWLVPGGDQPVAGAAWGEVTPWAVLAAGLALAALAAWLIGRSRKQ